MLRWIDVLFRLAYCAPPPQDDDDVISPETRRMLTGVVLAFGAVDLLDAVLDAYEAIRQMISGNRLQGGALLLGMLLARLVARTGHIVMEKKNGLSWVAGFQDPDDFMARFQIPQQRIIRSMFGMLFTELSIFMFEDVVLLAIWIDYGEFDPTDIFNQLNAWVTFLSAMVGMVLLIGSVLISLWYWTWKRTFCGVLYQLWKLVLFIAIFGVVVLFLLSSLLVGFQIITDTREEQRDFSDGLVFVLTVALSWVLAMFFSCRLSVQAKLPRPFVEPRNSKEAEANPEADPSSAPEATEVIAEETATIEGGHPFALAIPIDNDANLANHIA